MSEQEAAAARVLLKRERRRALGEYKRLREWLNDNEDVADSCSVERMYADMQWHACEVCDATLELEEAPALGSK